MKGISENLIFDTELETNIKVVSLIKCEYGNADVYRTEKGNYFIHNHGSTLGREQENVEMLTSEIEDLIGEWEDLESGEVIVYFEEFELG